LGKPWLARLPRLQRRINPFWAGGNRHMGMWTVADLWERETLTSLGIPKQSRGLAKIMHLSLRAVLLNRAGFEADFPECRSSWWMISGSCESAYRWGDSISLVKWLIWLRQIS
jgi:hypothetical protein